MKTITNKEIFDAAYSHILRKWCDEKDRSERFEKEFGRESELSKSRLEKYWEQLEELHEIILEMEGEEQ